MRVGKSVKTQLSKNVIYQFDGDNMFRPNLAIFRSIWYIQLTVKKRKHITYAYIGVLHICGVQRDLVVYRIKRFV